ncbi:FecR family protein [Bacteroides reticulotermitis]|uniref:FecR family protein n=1 Tax=Bacteroides reticulotermitis TaxID=1133319 RepID=UPI003A8AA7EB
MGIKNKKDEKVFDSNELPEEEKRLFEAWLEEKDHRALLSQWSESSSIQRDLIKLRFLKERKRYNLKRFVHAIHRKQRWRNASIAASFLLLLGLGTGLFYFITPRVDEPVVLIPEVDHPVMLRTASRIEFLANHQPINSLEQQGVRIYTSEEKISYSKEGNYLPSINDSLLYNELIVPRGKIYDVELADGTTVRLNSESRLRYPILFKENSPREVFLQGEGYFRVQADAEHPFIVHSPRVKTFVYGTIFNIKAYPKDSYSNVTLIEGKLKVTDAKGLDQLLHPKQEINCNNDTFVSVPEETNVEDIISWSEGKLYFNNRKLSDIAKDLERKYDIKIVFNSPATKQLIFYSKTQKFNQIESILELLKLTGEVDYQIKGRTVYLNEGNENN